MNNTKNKIDELYEKLLTLVSDERYLDEIERAHDLFSNGLDEEAIEIGFNQWLMFDYVFQNGSSFIDELLMNNLLDDAELAMAAKNSILSVFKVFELERYTYIKDVFTKEDYMIENVMDIDRNPVIARVITYKKKNYIIEVVNEWAEESEDSIRKSIYEKYNEYCSKIKNTEISEFLRKNSIIIYKYLMIYKDIKIKSVFQDEEFFLHLATYSIMDMDMFNKSINESENIVFQTDEYDNDIYELSIDDVVMCEIEVISNRFEIQCRNNEDLVESVNEINKIFKNSIVKLKEEVLNVEDLI